MYCVRSLFQARMLSKQFSRELRDFNIEWNKFDELLLEYFVDFLSRPALG